MTRFLLVLITAFAPAAVAAPALSPFEAQYTVRMGPARGEMDSSLERLDDGLKATSVLRPRGLARLFASGRLEETAWFAVDDARVVADRYRMVDTLGRDEKTAALDFDRDSGLAVGHDEGTPVEHAIDRATYDRASIQYALMLDLLAGRRPSTATLLDGDRRKSLAITYPGEQTVDVPYGPFDVTVVQHQSEGSSRRTVLYCAAELGYLPVRIEQYRYDKLKVRAELTGYAAE